MKRGILLLVFVTAAMLAIKLAGKSPRLDGFSRPSWAAPAPRAGEPESAAGLLARRYRAEGESTRKLVERVASRFGRQAWQIEQEDGLLGLKLLDRLDLEALYLREQRPQDFRKLRHLVGDDAAAELLVHWREYFGLKREANGDRALLIDEIAALDPARLKLAAERPALLPLLLAEPEAMAEFLDQARTNRLPEAELQSILGALALFGLEDGPASLRRALAIATKYPRLAARAFQTQGLPGFLVLESLGDVAAALEDQPLEQVLILLLVNQDQCVRWLGSHRAESLAEHVRRVLDRGLFEAAGGCPGALALAIDQGTLGERALEHAGPDAALALAALPADPVLARQATAALAEHGKAALLLIEKYAHDPEFCTVIRRHGAAAIPPIAQVDLAPEAVAHLAAKPDRTLAETLALGFLFTAGSNGQAMIRAIEHDGLARVLEQDDRAPGFEKFLPLYDAAHLGSVALRGYVPSREEAAWAAVDLAFVAADVLGLIAGPEGALAASAAGQEARAAVRFAARSEMELLSAGAAGRAGSQVAKVSSERLARYWGVRSAGGVSRILARTSEAMERLDLAAASRSAKAVAARMGLVLSAWKPVEFLRSGVRVIVAIPPQKGLKYLGVQMASAGAGAIAFQKMEEHLKSKRTAPAASGRTLEPAR